MVSNSNRTNQEDRQLAEYLVQRVCDRAAGRTEGECLRNYPRDVYFIGNLRPRPANVDDESGHLRELINKLAPVAFGAEFLLQPDSDEIEITVKVRWVCYYRIFPTLHRQREHQQQVTEADSEANNDTGTVHADNDTEITEIPLSPLVDQSATTQEEPSEEDNTIEAEREREGQLAELESPEVTESAHDRRRGRTPRDTLFIRFCKIPCEATGQIILRHSGVDEWAIDVSNLRAALDQETARSQQVALNDPERVRTSSTPASQIRVPETALISDADYRAFLRSLQTDVVPEWRWEVSSEVRYHDADPTKLVVLIEFVNTSPQRDNPNIEAFLFDTQAAFIFTGTTVHPFELELAPRGFRYDRELWGRGFNCAVDRQLSQPITFVATHTLIYPQMRYVTREAPPARFADLANNSIPTLRAIVNAMEAYRQIWEQERQRYIATNPDWEVYSGNEFDRDPALWPFRFPYFPHPAMRDPRD